MVLLQTVFIGYILALLFAVGGIASVIYTDAKRRGVQGSDPTYWAAGTFVIPFIIIPLYAYYAPRLGDRPERTARERWLIWLAGTVGTAIFAGWTLAPPDPFTILLAQIALLVPVGTAFYLLVFREEYERIYRHVPEG